MKAALYVRVSTEAQAERWSLPAQRRALVEFCERQGWTYELYEDAGISGETLDARPAMVRLLDDARHSRVDVVVAVEMERFSRSESLFDWLVIKQAFREGQAKFGTPQQLYDPFDPEDDFLSDLFGALSKREKRKILQRTMRAKIEAARRGRHVAPAPFGYVKSAPGQVAIDEPAAQTVRLIYALLLEGRSTAAIVRELARRSIPAPRGDRFWNRATVKKILANPAYVGRGAFNRLEWLPAVDGHKRRRRVRPEAAWVPIAFPRIIPDEMFALARKQLQRNAVLAPRNQRRFYLLKSLVRCSRCGSAMVGHPHKRQAAYVCSRACQPIRERRCKYVPAAAAVIEEIVWQQVVAILREPQVILDAARRSRENHLSQRDELLLRLDAVRAALAEIPEARGRVQRLYRDNRATLDETNAQIDELEAQQRALLEERDTLEARLSARTADETEAAALSEIVARFAHRLETLTDAERFTVVHAFVRRIIVRSKTEIEIQALVPAAGEPAGRYVSELWEHQIPARL